MNRYEQARLRQEQQVNETVIDHDQNQAEIRDLNTRFRSQIVDGQIVMVLIGETESRIDGLQSWENEKEVRAFNEIYSGQFDEQGNSRRFEMLSEQQKRELGFRKIIR